MRFFLYCAAFCGLLLSGSVFGFFYAWVCSTMWGLDAADPKVAIAAMQAMNASVRNIVFAPAFFGTPFVLLASGLLAWLSQMKKAALLFSLAGVLYFFGGMVLTMTVNVPMNEALALIVIPENAEEALHIWQSYSQEWQLWNVVRTVISAVVLLITGLAIFSMRQNVRTSL